MADLTFCATCYALTSPEDAKAHAAEHVHIDRRFDALSRQNTQYLQDIATLKGQIAAYGKQLDAHPISMDPETITVSKAPEYNDADLDVYLDENASDDQLADLVDVTVTPATSDPFAPEYPPAIDRVDEPTPYTGFGAPTRPGIG